MTGAPIAWEPGTELPELALPPISRYTLSLFAGASGDHNPIHIDLDFARSAGRDDVFAHGMLSMAYVGRLLTAVVPIEAIRSYSVRFASITPVHAQLTCRGRILSVDTADGEQRARLQLEGRLQDGTVTVRGEAVVALPA